MPTTRTASCGQDTMLSSSRPPSLCCEGGLWRGRVAMREGCGEGGLWSPSLCCNAVMEGCGEGGLWWGSRS